MLPPGALRETASAKRDWMRALEMNASALRHASRTLPRAVEEWGLRYGEKPALVSEEESYSFLGLSARLNQYARWAPAKGLGKGSVVALMMRNRAEYPAIWLGLTRIGAVVALINPDLRGAALAHALRVCEAAAAIVTPAEIDGLRECGFAGQVFVYGPQPEGLRAELADFSGLPLEAEAAPVTLDDRALRIFTSGTTGMPKAAEVSHRRLVSWTHWFAGLAGFASGDRHYNCLPMHHSVGGVVAIGTPLVAGGTAVIGQKFSARRFWAEFDRFECTSFQYIGELCRYLMSAHDPGAETRRRLKLALGNGMAAPVWAAFKQRFPETRVLEFYASSEGNVWLYNVEGRFGALGRQPSYVAAKAPLALVAFDEEAQAPLRSADGFCIKRDQGEALGRIASDAASRFEGYSDARDTEKKILRDVFEPGDRWMRTGDLMRRDADGFYYFIDRVGDTFRWKGENVATAEIAAALRACPGVTDALVYGVAVPGYEGKAGMATLEGSFEWRDLKRCIEALPRYSRPVFLRTTAEIARTETFKPRRAPYVLEGFDPSRTRDPLYVREEEGYLPLDRETYEAIVRGDRRLP